MNDISRLGYNSIEFIEMQWIAGGKMATTSSLGSGERKTPHTASDSFLFFFSVLNRFPLEFFSMTLTMFLRLPKMGEPHFPSEKK